MIVLDFEASALVRGYPIAVGIAASDGRLYYRVIKPHSSWRDLKWDPRSEQIHGLSRDFIAADGVEPRQVVEEINEMFAGETLVSDNREFEARWLTRLVEAAGVRPTFELGDIEAGALVTAMHARRGSTATAAMLIDREIGKMARHHALSDAAAWVAGLEATAAWTPATTEGEIDALFVEWRARVTRYLEWARSR